MRAPDILPQFNGAGNRRRPQTTTTTSPKPRTYPVAQHAPPLHMPAPTRPPRSPGLRWRHKHPEHGSDPGQRTQPQTNHGTTNTSTKKAKQPAVDRVHQVLREPSTTRRCPAEAAAATPRRGRRLPSRGNQRTPDAEKQPTPKRHACIYARAWLPTPLPPGLVHHVERVISCLCLLSHAWPLYCMPQPYARLTDVVMRWCAGAGAFV
jgi:hypothetical protein